MNGNVCRSNFPNGENNFWNDIKLTSKNTLNGVDGWLNERDWFVEGLDVKRRPWIMIEFSLLNVLCKVCKRVTNGLKVSITSSTLVQNTFIPWHWLTTIQFVCHHSFTLFIWTNIWWKMWMKNKMEDTIRPDLIRSHIVLEILFDADMSTCHSSLVACRLSALTITLYSHWRL